MAIRVYLDDVLRARGMTAKELCAKVGITEANLSILRSGKARGVRFGRPEIPDSEATKEAVRLYRQNKIPLSAALDMSGIGKTTFYKKLKEFSA